MDLLKHAPNLDRAAAAVLAKKLYGLLASATPLPSERDQNYLLTTESGDQFVLKIANALEDRTLLEAQNAVMVHLGRGLSFCPQPVPTLTGKLICQIEETSGREGAINARHFVRLVTYLPGIPLGMKGSPSPKLLWDLGKKLGQVDRALSAFHHEAFHRDFHWDLAKGLDIVGRYSPLIDDVAMRATILSYVETFQQTTSPLLPRLRRSIIHNDANDYNVIVSDSTDKHVTGLIDFGDMLYSYTVGEVAVAIAYIILDKADPLEAATHVVEGYVSEYKLNNEEVEALFGLALMRLCMSVCLAAHQQQQQPGNSYLMISQRAIAKTLPRLISIEVPNAAAAFRRACISD